jgi:hypothetical protein
LLPRSDGSQGSRIPDPLVFLSDRSGTGCPSTPVGVAWQLPDGTLAPVRCTASNRCPYCARMAAYEVMTMLRIDAEENEVPSHVITLTCRHVMVYARLREAHAVFWRAFRRSWGAVEYAGFMEWTTGEGPRAGGIRRPHTHYLVKRLCLPVGVVATRARGDNPCRCRDIRTCVECWTAMEWQKLAGAWFVQVRELRHAGGIVGYLALHHRKWEQAAPKGWTGRRLRTSRGYFAVPNGVLRERARAYLKERRLRGRLAAEGREDALEGLLLAALSEPKPKLVRRNLGLSLAAADAPTGATR